MKLNLGCGTNKAEGYVNVDRVGTPDLKWDLEAFPWPWEDSSVEEIRAHHVLEHLGQAPAVFISVLKEMYRVCKPGAKIDIVVPHPRHDDFLSDPTHVRAITARTFGLFSQRLNREWEAEGWSDSKLGLEHGIDFEIRGEDLFLDEHVQKSLDEGHINEPIVRLAISQYNNIVKMIRITLEVIK